MSVLRSASLRYADAGLNADDRCKIIAGTGMRKRRNTGVFPWRHLFITLVISHCDVSAWPPYAVMVVARYVGFSCSIDTAKFI